MEVVVAVAEERAGILAFPAARASRGEARDCRPSPRAGRDRDDRGRSRGSTDVRAGRRGSSSPRPRRPGRGRREARSTFDRLPEWARKQPSCRKNACATRAQRRLVLDVLELHAVGACQEERTAVLGVHLAVHVDSQRLHGAADVVERFHEETEVVEQRPAGRLRRSGVQLDVLGAKAHASTPLDPFGAGPNPNRSQSRALEAGSSVTRLTPPSSTSPSGSPGTSSSRSPSSSSNRALERRARDIDGDATQDSELARSVGVKQGELAQQRIPPDEDEVVRLLDDAERKLGENARRQAVRVRDVQRDVIELVRLQFHPRRDTPSAGGKTRPSVDERRVLLAPLASLTARRNTRSRTVRGVSPSSCATRQTQATSR